MIKSFSKFAVSKQNMEMDSLATRLDSLKETLEGDLKYDHHYQNHLLQQMHRIIKNSPLQLPGQKEFLDLKKTPSICFGRENRNNNQGCRHFTCRSGC